MIPRGGPSTPLRDRVGIAAGNTILWVPNDAVRRQALKAIADTGARWVTMDLFVREAEAVARKAHTGVTLRGSDRHAGLVELAGERPMVHAKLSSDCGQ